MTQLLLFDIDGTLLYTGGTGRIAFERAFEELFGVPKCWGNLSPDGKTDPLIIDEIVQRTISRDLTRSEYQMLCERYHQHFREEIKNPPRFKIMPGIPELLESLKARPDVLMGVSTGNFEEAAWSKLERGGMNTYFSFGGFGEDAAGGEFLSVESEENLNDVPASIARPVMAARIELTRKAFERGKKALGKTPEKVFVIGDTVFDVLAGRAVGARTVAVATGSTPPEILRSVRPDHLFADFSRPADFLTLL